MQQGGFLFSPAGDLPATIERNATVWCSCSFPSSFTAHLMSCCCLVFNLYVLSTLPHCSFIWWIMSPSAGPLTNCCEPGFSSRGSYTYLCSQLLLRVVNCCLVHVRPPGWREAVASPNAGCSSRSGSLGRVLLCLWALLMILFTICIGNKGFLHPGLCFP